MSLNIRSKEAQLRIAVTLQALVNTAEAAEYMKECGWSLQAALYVLLGVDEKFQHLNAEFYLKSEQRYMAETPN